MHRLSKLILFLSVFAMCLAQLEPIFQETGLGRILGDWEFAGIIGWRTGFWLTQQASTRLEPRSQSITNLVGDPKLSNPTIANCSIQWHTKQMGRAPTARRSLIPLKTREFARPTVRVEVLCYRAADLEIRVAEFNLLNHPVFDNPIQICRMPPLEGSSTRIIHESGNLEFLFIESDLLNPPRRRPVTHVPCSQVRCIEA